MLEIETKKRGAELTSIKFNDVERLHEVNSFWNEQSPILFPVVGKLKYGYTLINGQEYKIPFHGFAHLMDFEEIDKHSYKLSANEETLKLYPYEFDLYVFYTISKNVLSFNYKVVNKSKTEKMLFGVGATRVLNVIIKMKNALLNSKKKKKMMQKLFQWILMFVCFRINLRRGMMY